MASSTWQRPDEASYEKGRLSARARQVKIATTTLLPGSQPLRLGGDRDGLLYVPSSYRASGVAPFALMLHGAGGNAEHGLSLLRSFADTAGMILLAPESRRATWDVILGGYGPDVAFVDGALAQVFDRYDVNPTHIAVGGFSDGASYALSLGLTNGDVFTHVVAFSPGFAAPAKRHGAPRIFVSHGTRDEVLPISVCSRRVVPQLERAGYDVLYREFDGPHTVPPQIARQAAGWFIKTKAEVGGAAPK